MVKKGQLHWMQHGNNQTLFTPPPFNFAGVHLRLLTRPVAQTQIKRIENKKYIYKYMYIVDIAT